MDTLDYEQVRLRQDDLVLCDFDGTISVKDVGVAMIDAVEDPRGWELERQWRRGEIDSKQCLRGQWELMQWGRAGFEEFIAGLEVDKTFSDLWHVVLERDARLLVLSDGLDLYLDPILRRMGFEVCEGDQVLAEDFGHCVPRYVNHAYFREDRVQIEFPWASDLCDQCANCKLAHLMNLRRHFGRIIYVGDGYSDECPAKYSDLVFAKAHLAELMSRDRLAYLPFETLGDVARMLGGQPDKGFEMLDHTADYALRVWGRDLAELIEAAAAGIIAVMVERGGLQPAAEALVEVESEDKEALVHDALRELLYLFEEGQVPIKVTAKVDEGGPRETWKARLKVGVVPLEQVRDRLLSEVKAVTYHGLQVRREGDRLVTQVVLDV